MQDCTFLCTCLVSNRPTHKDPFVSIDNLCGNLHQDHLNVDSFLSLIKYIFGAPSKPLLPFHNDAQVVLFSSRFQHSILSCCISRLGKGLYALSFNTCYNLLRLLLRGSSASLKFEIQEGLQASDVEALRDTSVTSCQNSASWYHSYACTLHKNQISMTCV